MHTDDERRSANRAAIRHCFTHMSEMLESGIEEVAKYRTKETVTRLPFGGGLEPMRSSDHGMSGMRTVPVTFKFWRWDIVRIFDCLDPDVFWVEADAVARTRTLDLDYRQRYVNMLRFEDGKLTEIVEYFNGDEVLSLMRERQHQERWSSGVPAR